MLIRLMLLFILAFVVSFPTAAQNREQLSGWCEDGGQVVTTDNRPSTTKVQRSYPSCTVTVYEQGTTTLAAIYSDYINTPKANPFTAATTGQWAFVAAAGRYDVRFSGAGITTPFTRSGLWVSSATTDQIGTAATITADQNNYTADGLGTTFIRLSSDASRNITGLLLTTQGPGDSHWLLNVGGNNIVLQNQNAASAAANRFLNASGGDYTMSPNSLAFTVYDDTTQRWRTVSVSSLVDPGTNGIMVRTALNTIVTRTIVGTANQVIVTNGDGTAGNPTLSTPQDIATTSSPTFANLTLSSGGILTISGAGQINTGASSTFTLGAGSAIQTGTGVGDTLLLRAYDTDTGPAYATFIRLTAGTAPTLELGPATLLGDISAATFSINNATNFVGINGASHLRTGTTAGNTLTLDAYDTDTGPAYTTFITLAAGTTPTLVVNQTFQVNSTITGNANSVTLNLNAATATADLTLGSTPGTIRQLQASSIGTRDLIWRATPDSSSGFAIFEGATSAGTVVRTTGNTNPVIFQVNSVEVGRFVTGTIFHVGNGLLQASPATGIIRSSSATGTNVAGGNLELMPGLGTGNAAQASVLSRFVKSTASGTGAQSYTTSAYKIWHRQLLMYTDSTAISNTTTETSLITGTFDGSKTLEGGTLEIGGNIRCSLNGVWQTNGTTPTLTIRVKAGATTIGTVAVTMPNVAGSDTYWEFSTNIVARTVGATATILAQPHFTWHTTGGGGASALNAGFGGSATSIDITADQTIDITAQWGAAAATNTITTRFASFDIVP